MPKNTGLVSERRAGRQRLNSESLSEPTGWLAPYEQFWQDRLHE